MTSASPTSRMNNIHGSVDSREGLQDTASSNSCSALLQSALVRLRPVSILMIHTNGSSNLVTFIRIDHFPSLVALGLDSRSLEAINRSIDIDTFVRVGIRSGRMRRIGNFG